MILEQEKRQQQIHDEQIIEFWMHVWPELAIAFLTIGLEDDECIDDFGVIFQSEKQTVDN